MKNHLFNKTLLKKHSKNFKLNPRKHDLLKEYISKIESGDFKSETKNYLYFYDVILKGVLGYKREDVLFDEKEDTGLGKSEFVLKSDDKKFMVIELKGQGINLDKRQSGRSDNKSPIEQAFGYAINTGDVDWIMVSNYEEFRLYNYYEKTKFISFNIKELLDKEKFAYFMLSFSRDSHIKSDTISRVKKDTLIVDRKLANQFYKLYNETRLMLIKELESESQMKRLDSIHYAQLILNRYMFICFAEDTNLLPSQISVDTISTPIIKGNIRHSSIFQRLNELFIDINEGNQFKKINEYNGGLFFEDLDFIKIRDMVEDQDFFKDVYQEWNFTDYEKDINHLLGNSGFHINPIYRNMLTISSFDFSTELDVNILGHIFENSIGDIEELKEGSKGRRKKEGIFYTPDYITDYICRNTIIPYLSESGNVNTVDELLGEYWGSKIEELDQKVKEIKIVDPACGSGAFLNKASDILLEIHRGIHQTRYKGQKDTLIPYFDSIEERREILLNNIYGVDLNEESVDITKLSLFLKVCRKGLKLPNLDKNIKCGNSLIYDPEFTYKPFNWETEFSEIIQNDGFDIVIGNPPYVRQEQIRNIKPYLKEQYRTFYGTADLYVYFFEKGLEILKNGGNLGFISSNKFIRTKYGKELRKYILKNTLFRKYIDHSHDNVFEDATTYPGIFILKKGTPNNNNILVNDTYQIQQSRLSESVWNFERPEILDLKDKIKNKTINLKNIEGVAIFYGIKTGYNKAFVIDEETKSNLIKDDPNNKDILRPLVMGKDIKRYNIFYKNLYLILTKNGVNIDNYPLILNHLKGSEKQLNKRQDQGNNWFNLRDCAYYSEFDKEKIIWGEIAMKPKFTLDTDRLFLLNTCYLMTLDNENYDLRYLIALINSKLICWQFRSISTSVRGGYWRYTKQYVEKIPIYPATPEEQQTFIEKTDKMLQLNKKLKEEVNDFNSWIQKEFGIDKLSQKLEKYYKLSEDEFMDELRKKKVDTKVRKNREYLEREFNESIKIINPVLQEIKQTDDKIDKMVYELYELTDKEIGIIENSLK